MVKSLITNGNLPWCRATFVFLDLLNNSASIKSGFRKATPHFSLCVLPGTSTLFISCPPHCALTHRPLTLHWSLPGGDHLKTSPSPLLPTLQPSVPQPIPVINWSQWEVWTLTSQNTLKTESRGAPKIADVVGGTDTLSPRLWEALRDALSFSEQISRPLLNKFNYKWF